MCMYARLMMMDDHRGKEAERKHLPYFKCICPSTELLMDYFYSGRPYKLILKRLQLLHNVDRR